MVAWWQKCCQSSKRRNQNTVRRGDILIAENGLGIEGLRGFSEIPHKCTSHTVFWVKQDLHIYWFLRHKVWGTRTPKPWMPIPTAQWNSYDKKKPGWEPIWKIPCSWVDCWYGLSQQMLLYCLIIYLKNLIVPEKYKAAVHRNYNNAVNQCLCYMTGIDLNAHLHQGLSWNHPGGKKCWVI